MPSIRQPIQASPGIARAPQGLSPLNLGTRHAHDPTVVQADDGSFVMFCTDAQGGRRCGAALPPGVHLRTSPDLVHWTWRGTALPHVPHEAAAWSGAEGLWAPEVVRWHNPDAPGTRFHMYYSASTFGSNTSAIGLAVADDLLGPWRAQGIVVRTHSGEHTQNAIDAEVTWDADGEPWLTYGSFFSGIYTLRLDRLTGLPATPGDLGLCVARRRHEVEAAIEGVFLVRRDTAEGTRYVMFASYDSLFSSYSVQVAMSDRITGPYLDRAGNAMTDLTLPPDAAGTPLLVGHQFTGGSAWLAPGHSSVLSLHDVGSTDGPVGDFLVHHVRIAEDPTEHTGQIRRLLWTASGWPAVSPQAYAGTPTELIAPTAGLPTGDSSHLAGRWDVLDLRLPPDGGPSGPITRSRLLDVPDGDLRAIGAADVVLHGSYDWVRHCETVSFSGFTSEGTAISGTLLPPYAS